MNLNFHEYRKWYSNLNVSALKWECIWQMKYRNPLNVVITPRPLLSISWFLCTSWRSSSLSNPSDRLSGNNMYTQHAFSETASVTGVIKTQRVICDAGTEFGYFRWNLLVNFRRQILALQRFTNSEPVSFFPSAEDSGVAGANNPVTLER